MDFSSSIARLRALDPAAWGTGLSPENARACWAGALDALDPAVLAAPVPGRAPRAVLIVGSGNVFTAPLPWMLHLVARGVRVLIKPATGHEIAVRAMAEGLAEVREWRGGDVDAEAAALAEVDGAIGFGGAEAMDAIGARVPPGVVWLPFGPRFGVAVVERPPPALAVDHALYDGRGCMSPAAVFAQEPDLDTLAAAMADAEARWPRGALDPAEGAAIRARVAEAKVLGEARTGPGWAVLQLPLARFAPEALPRVLVVHPYTDVDEVRAALAPWRSRLGTVATDTPGLSIGQLRTCAPGRMQLPPAGRIHDGVDVLGRLWSR